MVPRLFATLHIYIYICSLVIRLLINYIFQFTENIRPTSIVQGKTVDTHSVTKLDLCNTQRDTKGILDLFLIRITKRALLNHFGFNQIDTELGN